MPLQGIDSDAGVEKMIVLFMFLAVVSKNYSATLLCFVVLDFWS